DHLRAGRFDDVEAICRATLAADPSHRAARYTLATMLLARGADDEGWPLYEARQELPETGIRAPNLRYPRWAGESVERLLVIGEQGHGDQIFFGRYLPLLADRGIRVTLLCRPALTRLFAGLAPEVHPMVGALELPPHDAWCLLGSLPLHLGFAGPESYLPSSLGGAGVGVMTAGNPAFSNNAERSLSGDAARRVL